MNNILVIDKEENESIIYHKNEISSVYDYMPDFHELMEIFNDDPEMIFKVNTKKCISLIDKSGNVHSISELSSRTDDICFIKLSDDLLKSIDAEIYIDYDFYRYSEVIIKKWSESRNREVYTDFFSVYLREYAILNYNVRDNAMHISNSNEILTNMKAFADGYKICNNIINKSADMNTLINSNGNVIRQLDAIVPPLIMHCDKFRKYCNNAMYKGYVPSLYQMELICRYMPIMDFFMEQTDKMSVTNKKSFYSLRGGFWTANEFDGDNVLGINKTSDGYKIVVYDKTSERKVFPIYKKV